MEITPTPQAVWPFGSIEAPYPVHYVGERVDGERRERRLRKGSCAVEAVEVDAVVRMRMCDEDRVNILGRAVLKKPGERTKSEIKDHSPAG